MGYEPLHHKYRPQRFSEVVGQEPIVATLTNAIRAGRIANAYLFTGSRGTGKTTTARLMAKALNCVDGPTPSPCGTCENCRAVAAGSALDVIEIDAASNTGVDNIRELIERAQFAPAQSLNKVYIIDEVHMLSSAAFNCLLKTLEEPPPRVVFILATTDPQKVLPTVISRCQRFDFRRIPLVAMVDHLEVISKKEHIDIDREALELVAQIAQGGLRDAESLLDQLALLDGRVGAERVWQLVGSVPERELLALAESIRSGEGIRVLEQTRRLLDSGKEALLVLQDLTAFYRDLLIARTAPDRRDLTAITAPTWERMVEHARSYDLAEILALQERLRAAEPQVKGTTQPRLWLEVSLVGLTSSAPAQRLPAPAQVHPAAPPAPRSEAPPAFQAPPPLPVESLRPAPTSQPEPAPALPPTAPPPQQASPAPRPEPATPPPPASPPPAPSRQGAAPAPGAGARPAAVTPADLLRQRWQEFLQMLDPPTKGLLGNAFVARGTEKEILLGFANEAFVKKANEPKRLRNIQEALATLIGFRGAVQFVRTNPPPAGASKAAPQPSAAPVNGTAYTPAPSAPNGPAYAAPPPPQAAPPPVAPAPSGAAPPPVPPPPAPRPTIEEPDELDRTTRNLADFFNGEIIHWDGEVGNGEINHRPPALADDDDDEPF